jgi:hypothetical protein
MAHSDPEKLKEEELHRLVEHLKSEELEADDARLTSVDSLKAWIAEHPTLQQAGAMEIVQLYGPAILEMIRRMLGM